MRGARSINKRITSELQRRGYPDTRPGHAALLANLDMTGNSVTEIAERAEISKQAMARLAVELEELGYISRGQAKDDARALTVRFTPLGVGLIQTTVNIVDEVESGLASTLGQRGLERLKSDLRAVAEVG